MSSSFQILGFIVIFGLLMLSAITCEAQTASGARSLRTLAAERAANRQKPPSAVSASSPQVIRYSGSAQASNMIVPAILLGLPTIVILALIIRAMKGD
jgi:hypothetical protein